MPPSSVALTPALALALTLPERDLRVEAVREGVGLLVPPAPAPLGLMPLLLVREVVLLMEAQALALPEPVPAVAGEGVGTALEAVAAALLEA